MKHGFVLPFSDPRLTADLAREAEEAGWDGIFVADLVWGSDAWVQLAAAAMQTSRIRLGTLLTPIPWKQPWKLAGETAALDRLSGGRVILSAGLGAPDAGATAFGVPLDKRIRGELLDEGLDVLEGLWGTPAFAYEGKHYQVRPTSFPAPLPPLQQPRIPIWAVGVHGRSKSMSRVLRCDGLIPARIGENGAENATPGEVREMAAFLAEHGGGRTFEVIADGETENDARGRDTVAAWADAGATWWVESRWQVAGDDDGIRIVRERIAAGPAAIR